MAKTKRPTGITITRSGNDFIVEWKIGDSDYGSGQQFQYRINNGKWLHLGQSSDIGKKVTKQKYTFPASNYYPSSGKSTKVSKISFRIRGKRKSYTKKGKTIKPEWSEWEPKEYKIALPKTPTLTATWNSNLENVTNFAWTATRDNSAAMYTKVEWQSVLTEDSKTSKYGASEYSSATSGTITKTESNSVINNGKSHKRWVRIRSLNPRGASAWVVKNHIYADPKNPFNFSATATPKNGVVDVICTFNTSRPKTNPIDSIKIEYMIAQPLEGLSVPDGNWTTGATVAYSTGNDKSRFTINSNVADEQCLFLRASTVHDNNENPSEPYIAYMGKLLSPSVPITSQGTGGVINVASTNASQVEDSFLAVTYHDMQDSENSYIAGIIENGNTSVNITVPESYSATTVKFGVKAYAGAIYEEDTRADGSICYNIISNASTNMDENINNWMESDEVWTASTVRPSDITVVQKGTDGTARVMWEWNQNNVSGAQIAWADHDDAWESTDEPETYEVPVLNSPSWNIADLEAGKTWYFRLRFYIEDENTTQYSPWSEMASLRLTSAPAIPTLILSNEIALEGEDIDASWVYISSDGTMQSYAEIREVTYSGGSPVYGDVVGSTESSQKITISPSELGWETGSTHYLAIRVRSASGRDSEWSETVTLTVVEPVECTIASTSLVSETIDERSVMSLKDMPMTVTVTGAGDSEVTSVVIERASSYFVERPDEGRQLDGYEGEAVFVHNQVGEEQVTIDLDSLIGRLDDGAPYRLVATVSDSYGQKDTKTLDFEVHWSHQAIMPEGSMTINQQDGIAVITPTAPTGATQTDVCDIYRLSADKPVLIYPDASFGTSYVDPYPTIGVYGGYRIVFRTANGDYITDENTLAWLDLEEGLEVNGNIIDFGGDKITLTRNLDVSHSWDKDFTETKYLGGSVQGDWNPAVSRTASMSSAAVTLIDEDEILAMRDLAEYVGICNIRTRDGSNFKGDVQVSESRNHGNGGYVADFSLKITRVDSEGYDGMTLEEWNESE